MSRSTVAKSRTEKASKSASIATPAVAHEIVPGKFNDQDWNSMLEQDDADDFVEQIVEDVCASAVNIIFSKYIESQLVPYTVLQAKDALVQIIEWRFLARDCGETSIETDSGWMQDEEPEPSCADCWAQGAVPKTIIEKPAEPVTTSTPDSLKLIAEESMDYLMTQQQEDIPEDDSAAEEEITKVDEDEEDEEEEEQQQEPEDLQEQQEETTSVEAVPTETEEPEKKTITRELHVCQQKKGKPSVKSEGSKRTESPAEVIKGRSSHPPNSAHLASFQLPSSCQSLLKLQHGRPPGKQDVVLDKNGFVTDTGKIDVDRISSNRVRTRFVVIDPGMEAAKSRLEELRTGRQRKSGRPDMVPVPPPHRPSKTPNTVVSSVNPRHVNTGSALGGMASLPPPMIEAMDVSAGVAVREGDRVKKGPGQKLSRADFMSLAARHQLRPIRTQADMPSVSVMELVMNQSPVVRPILETPPIPPIDSKPLST